MNFIDVALMSGVGIFTLFSLQLLTSIKGNLLLNKLFAFFLLSRAIQNIFILILEHHQQLPFSFLNYLFPILMILTPSVVYLYVRTSINDTTSLYKKDLVHLIPSFIIVFAIFFRNTNLKSGEVYFLIHEEISLKNPSEFLRIIFLFGFRLVLNIFYIILSWKLIIKATANKIQPLNLIIKNWLIFFVSLLSFFFISNVIFFIYTIINHLPPSNLFDNTFMVFLISLVIFSLIFYIIKHPTILYGQLTVIVKSAIDSIVIQQKVDSPIVLENNSSYSLLTAEQILNYTRSFQNFVAANKPYLDTELTITKFANDINIPLHHCSYFLNNVLHLSFRDYVNQFRVNHFINEYPNKVAKMTIESMAEKAGFKNRSTFNIAFKKETGLTPSDYFSKSPIV
jgi:AraC-like DNA-binding protein